MDLVQFLLVLVVLAAVVAVISSPLRGRRPAEDEPASADASALEAARDAKYREIREAELDWRTGKLSHEDWEAIDRRLRAEAFEILRELDRGPQPRSDQTTS